MRGAHRRARAAPKQNGQTIRHHYGAGNGWIGGDYPICGQTIGGLGIDLNAVRAMDLVEEDWLYAHTFG
jgi:hypothetical protein